MSIQKKPTHHTVKPINLALQGGGAHGAFTWGVMDQLLEDGRIGFESISGTSAGSMNAVVYAYGAIHGPEAAREKLHEFWKAISTAGDYYNPIKRHPFEKMFFGHNLDHSPTSEMLKMITHIFSPYQLNPTNFNPLKSVLESVVDFDELKNKAKTKLFLSATNVRTGKVKVFSNAELTPNAIIASACLPYMFQAVEINGEYYWDGGFMGNPVLYPLFYKAETSDVLIVHVNPIERPAPPMSTKDIFNRINEITFNCALLKELRAVHFVQKLISNDWIKDEYKNKLKMIHIHSLRTDKALSDLSVSSKFLNDWDFLIMLRNRGRTAASQWLEENYHHVGVRNSVDLAKEFL